ncbi:MAG: M42 family metallopeptidase [Oscillospiraceae bacterium]|nr:M42 family metallopeptidase [Oscillospiraceae bacterium]
MLDRLKELCVLDGISGDENAVRDYICKEIIGHAEFKIDNLGNVIAFKKGKNTPKNKIMISAHMDEVGMIVNFINSDGTLKISSVGGVDPRVVFGRQVFVGKNKINGVIGAKAVHNLTADEKDTAVTFDKMYVDIGCENKEEAEKLVSLGDSVTFSSEFVEYGDGFVKGKAIDDRAGCAVMLEMIKSDLEYDTYFTFVVQEEIGLRGSRCAAFSVEPDYAIVIESTTAADIPSASGADRVCELKKGPVVSFMDRSTIYNKELYNLAFECAKKIEIPCQTKTRVAGGNDAGAIHLSKGGVKTIAVSVPTRYLHSPSCVINKEDYFNTLKLVKALTDRIYNR